MNCDNFRLVILQGPNGSGKSHTARRIMASSKNPDNWVVASRQDIRASILTPEEQRLYASQQPDFSFEEYISGAEQSLIARALSAGKNVIVDNTNIRQKHVNEYVRLAIDFSIPESQVKLIRHMKIWKHPNDSLAQKQATSLAGATWDLSDCFKGVLAKKYVPKVWTMPSFEIMPYRASEGAQRAIVCDIDGTLAFRTVIKAPTPHLRGYFDYDEVHTDTFSPLIRELLIALSARDIKIIFLSGRQEDSRELTNVFLRDKCGFEFDYELLLRDPVKDVHDGQHDPDDVVKYRIFNEKIRNSYTVLGVIDDRKRVLAMWEALGVEVLNAGKLNEVF